MKTKMKSWITGMALLATAGALWAQPEAAISLNLRVVTGSIGPIDPLIFELSVTNETDAHLTNLPVWAIEETSAIEVMAPDSKEWKPMAVPYLERLKNRCVPLDHFLFELKPREKKSFEMHVIYDPYISYQQERPHYYFAQPGEYRLRASYQLAKGQPIYSNEARFTVQPYTGTDLDAYKWLKEKTLPHFMYDPETYVLVEMHEADEWAQELMNRFPNSRFAPWAQLYLANCYLLGLRTGTEILPPDVAQADRLAAGLVRSSDTRVRMSAEKLMQAIEQKRAILQEDR